MSKKIPERLRILTAERAGFRCEYCRIPDIGAGISFHSDHILASKHGGLTVLENLAYCCPECNLFKGTDFATFLSGIEDAVRFFNPRKDEWSEHFVNVDGLIQPRTEIGRATIVIFQINNLSRVLTRQQLMAVGLYAW